MIHSPESMLPDNIDVSTWFNPEYLQFQHPDVTRFLGSLSFNYEIINTYVTEDRVQGMLAEGGYEHCAESGIEVIDGVVDPPKLNRLVAERTAERDESLLPGLSEFTFHYSTDKGATEGIEKLMVGFAADDSIKKVGLIRGDYLGYYGTALAAGFDNETGIVWADSLEEIGEMDDEVVWFTSNPSAISGNLYNGELWQTFLAGGHKVVVDAAYIDLTVNGKVNVSAENIIAVITSPSKPYGLVFDKYPGGVHLRKSHPGLKLGGKFNNVPRLLAKLEVQLQEQFGPHKIAELHRPTQLAICRDMSEASGGMVLPSDATLMAYATGQLGQDYDTYRTVNWFERPEDYTFRLTREFARRALLGI